MTGVAPDHAAVGVVAATEPAHFERDGQPRPWALPRGPELLAATEPAHFERDDELVPQAAQPAGGLAATEPAHFERDDQSRTRDEWIDVAEPQRSPLISSGMT